MTKGAMNYNCSIQSNEYIVHMYTFPIFSFLALLTLMFVFMLYW